MNCFTLINSGLEHSAQQEISELKGQDISIQDNVIEFTVPNKEELLSLALRLQSVRRFLLTITKTKNLDKLDFTQFNWSDYLNQEISLKIEVENVKGQENRIKITKKITEKLFPLLKENNILPKIDYKSPDVQIIVFYNNKDYFIGLDFFGQEINKRFYRLFPHSASFKGDLAYYFIRLTKFVSNKKLLIGFSRDGVLAIEAALFANKLFIQDFNNQESSFHKFHLFKEITFKKEKSKETKIFAFDESTHNLISARKNLSIAKIKDFVEFNKYSLDELDVKYNQNEFDHLIFHLTTKDEDKLNEIYYQANYILKKKGELLFISREHWEFSLSDKFSLIKKEALNVAIVVLSGTC